ncbi:MAG: hypothetical protein ACI4IW_02285 [Oscillospiraceae bacterium]
MDIKSAGKFIYLNARPLDLARWRYLFEGGSREEVLRALSAYQNEDGGFGHGLEADCWNPNSSPVQTWAATEIIREIGLNDAKHPMIQGILKYLGSAADFDGHVWLNTVPSNNDYPHAPWWSYAPEQELAYNPTACLVGFIIKFADESSGLYALALRLAREAYAFLKAGYPLESMHTVSCFVELFEYLCECGRSADIDLGEFEKILHEQIKYILTGDTSLWPTEYVCKPSLFINSKNSVFYPENRDLCEFECGFISDTQGADGAWNITWEWGDYTEQWHISKNWWKSDLIIKNIKFYNAMRG